MPSNNMPGDGGIYSTALDLQKWGSFLNGTTVIGSDIPNMMMTTMHSDAIETYGMGLRINDDYVHHNGVWNGIKCDMRFYPRLSNSEQPAVWMSLLATTDILNTSSIFDFMKRKYDEAIRLRL